MRKPTKTRRRSSRLPRERREADILEAARGVFRQRGYEAASISEIAERAGVVEGSIYRYFQNKRDLLIKVIEQWYAGMIVEDEERLKTIPDTQTRLRHVIWHHLMSIREEPGLSRLVFSEFRPDPAYRQSSIFALNRRYTARLTEIVRAGIRAGEFRKEVSPALVRDMVFGCVEHHTWAFLRGEGDFDVDSAAESIAGLVCNGIRAPAASGRNAQSAASGRRHLNSRAGAP